MPRLVFAAAWPRVLLLLSPVVLSACQYAQPARLQPIPLDFKVYERERFSQQPAHARQLEVSAEVACQAGRRALLSQGYQLSDNELTRLLGRKYFRPANGTAVELLMTITCLRSPDDERRSSVYVTAWQDAYVTSAARSRPAPGCRCWAACRCRWPPPTRPWSRWAWRRSPTPATTSAFSSC